jgi:hypothetical protein
MHDSQRYRSNAADCLLAAQDARRPYDDRKVRLSMASSWLSLARQDEAMDDLFASWDKAEPINPDQVFGLASDPFVSGTRRQTD